MLVNSHMFEISRKYTYEAGDFFGGIAGTNTESLECSTSGHIGQTAVFVVMHRSTITVDQSWIFEDSHTQPDDGWSQTISIYKKVIASDSESFTITQAWSGLIWVCVYYFDKDVDITFRYDVHAENNIYTLPNIDSLSLVVGNLLWAKTSGSGQYTVNTNFMNPSPKYTMVSNRAITFITMVPATITQSTSLNATNAFYVFNIRY